MGELKLYNSLTKKTENFTATGIVAMYNCGPTVYDFVHLGNLRYFVVADLLRRYLEYSGRKVKQVMNITDVGHLMADADEGEDKIESAARRAGVKPEEITKKYTEVFFKDIDALNIKRAWKYPRATDHVKDMIFMISTLLKKGIAYTDGCNVYYDLNKFPDYGKLSGNTPKALMAGARVEVVEGKRQPYDFALWICRGGHLQQWRAPWGTGYPGWHIECSAMARKYLGDTIDIHTGGEDNKFPHHEAEIAQSEGATGKKFVRSWLHVAHLLVDGEKMSKSRGNFYTLNDIVKKFYSPRELRYLLLSAHYRDQLNFTFKSLEAAKTALVRLEEFLRILDKPKKGKGELKKLISQAREDFKAAMDDDLNISKALAILWGFVRAANAALALGVPRGEAREAKKFIKELDSVLGLDLRAGVRAEAPAAVRKLMEAREEARERKDFASADELRLRIKAEGYEVEDTPEGPELRALN